MIGRFRILLLNKVIRYQKEAIPDIEEREKIKMCVVPGDGAVKS